MIIVYNGQPREVPENITIAALLEQLRLSPKYVAVEVNQELAPRQQHAEHVLRAGDRVEIVTLVGGG